MIENQTPEQSELKQLLVFELDQEKFAVELVDLKEIISRDEVTPIPNSPDFVEGILNLRGKIVVVINFEKRFHLNRKNKIEQKHILITEYQDTSYGILVDKVDGVISASEGDIQPPPQLAQAKIDISYLKGVIVLSESENQQESELIILIDLQKILDKDELINIKDALPTEQSSSPSNA